MSQAGETNQVVLDTASCSFLACLSCSARHEGLRGKNFLDKTGKLVIRTFEPFASLDGFGFLAIDYPFKDLEKQVIRNFPYALWGKEAFTMSAPRRPGHLLAALTAIGARRQPNNHRGTSDRPCGGPLN